MDHSEEKIDENVVTLNYGFKPRGTYIHASKHCNVISVTFNSKENKYIVLDSRGISSWYKESHSNITKRLIEFEPDQYNSLLDIIYNPTANVYFGLAKDFGIKVLNVNFIELVSIETEGTTIVDLKFEVKSNELITICRNRYQFWKFSFVEKSRNSDALKLLRQFDIPDETSSITHSVYDEVDKSLYLISDHDIWCCDSSHGRCHVQFHHSRFTCSSFTTCAYMREANVLVAGTSNGEIPLYLHNGQRLTTILSHTRRVTALLPHPSDANLFLSASMDGTIKLYSLQVREEIYSINIFPDGVYFMKFRSSSAIYCASLTTVRLYYLNHFCSFWSTIRSPLKNIDNCPKIKGKSSHIAVHGLDKCIRIFSKRSGFKRSTILPPPEFLTTKGVLSYSYDRIGNVVYILFSEMQLWIYLTRTDPATRVAVWNILDIIRTGKSMIRTGDGPMVDEEERFGAGMFSKMQDEEKNQCLCTSTIPREIYKDVLNTVDNESMNFSLLLCGMSNGMVYFIDPSPPVSVVLGFKAHPTNPVEELRTLHDGDGNLNNTCILTLINTTNTDTYCVKIWNAKTFEQLDEITMNKDINVYCLKSSIFATGNNEGYLRIITLKGIENNSHDSDYNEHHTNKDHNGVIVSVDILRRKEVICTCGEDQHIRIWNIQKYLLTEIKLDETLSYASFLNDEGSILFGFKSHLFSISSNIVKLPSNDDLEYASDDSIPDSVVYEDPQIKREFGNIEFTTKNIENYLVPYPYLSLHSNWMYQAPISDQEDGGEEKDQDGDTESDIHADSEVYADTLCSQLSNVCLDFDMPSRGQTPVDEYVDKNVDKNVVKNVDESFVQHPKYIEEIETAQTLYELPIETVRSKLPINTLAFEDVSSETITDNDHDEVKNIDIDDIKSKNHIEKIESTKYSLLDVDKSTTSSSSKKKMSSFRKKSKTTKSNQNITKQKPSNILVSSRSEISSNANSIKAVKSSKVKLKKKGKSKSNVKLLNEEYHKKNDGNIDTDYLLGEGLVTNNQSLKQTPSIFLSMPETAGDGVELTDEMEVEMKCFIDNVLSNASLADCNIHFETFDNAAPVNSDDMMTSASDMGINDEDVEENVIQQAESEQSRMSDCLSPYQQKLMSEAVVQFSSHNIRKLGSQMNINSKSFKDVYQSMVETDSEHSLSSNNNKKTVKHSTNNMLTSTNDNNHENVTKHSINNIISSFHSRTQWNDIPYISSINSIDSYKESEKEAELGIDYLEGDTSKMFTTEQCYNESEEVTMKQCCDESEEYAMKQCYNESDEVSIKQRYDENEEVTMKPVKGVWFKDESNSTSSDKDTDDVYENIRLRRNMSRLKAKRESLAERQMKKERTGCHSDDSRVAVMALNRVKRQSKGFNANDFNSSDLIKKMQNNCSKSFSDTNETSEDDDNVANRFNVTLIDKEIHGKRERMEKRGRRFDSNEEFGLQITSIQRKDNEIPVSNISINKEVSGLKIEQGNLMKTLKRAMRDIPTKKLYARKEDVDPVQKTWLPASNNQEKVLKWKDGRKVKSIEIDLSGMLEMHVPLSSDTSLIVEEEIPHYNSEFSRKGSPVSQTSTNYCSDARDGAVSPTELFEYHSKMHKCRLSPALSDFYSKVYVDSISSTLSNYYSYNSNEEIRYPINKQQPGMRDKKYTKRRKKNKEIKDSRSSSVSGYGSNPPPTPDYYHCLPSKERLSVRSSPNTKKSQPKRSTTHLKLYSKSTDEMYKGISNGEIRRDRIKKLEHKMSSQPYRLQSCGSTTGDDDDEKVKLMFLKSRELGQEFLRYSKRRVTSIPCKNGVGVAKMK